MNVENMETIRTMNQKWQGVQLNMIFESKSLQAAGVTIFPLVVKFWQSEKNSGVHFINKPLNLRGYLRGTDEGIGVLF